MKKIIIRSEGTEISIDDAMMFYAWHEIVKAMEKDKDTVKGVVVIMQNKNVPNWEEMFLTEFMKRTDRDLIIG